MALYRCGGGSGSGGDGQGFEYASYIFNNDVQERYPKNGTCYEAYANKWFNNEVFIGNKVNNCSRMFYNCDNFNCEVELPDVGLLRDTSYMFSDCDKFNQPIAIPNSIANMQGMFSYCNNFNQPMHIYRFNSRDYGYSSSEIGGCVGMFYRCNAFNSPMYIELDSVLHNYCNLFYGCDNFNSAVMFNGDYPTEYEPYASEIYLNDCFQDCCNFNAPITFILNNRFSLYAMENFLRDCYKFNQPLNNLENIYYGNALLMNCRLFNHPITVPSRNWSGGYFTNMLSGCYEFNSIVTFENTVGKDISNCAYMLNDCINYDKPITIPSILGGISYMFNNCTKFNSLITFDDRAYGLNVTGLLSNCTSYNQPLSINSSGYVDCQAMLKNCTVYNKPIYFNVGNMGYMSSMFNGCDYFNSPITIISGAWVNFLNALTNCKNYNSTITITANNLDMSSAYSYYGGTGSTFNGCNCFNGNIMLEINYYCNCQALFYNHQYISNPNITINANNTFIGVNMFYNCKNFQGTINLTVNNYLNAFYMFAQCNNFPINLSANNINASYMLNNCVTFKSDVAITSNYLTASFMFNNCVGFNNNVNIVCTNSINASRMFSSCYSFNTQLDWNNLNFNNASMMFTNCYAFDQPIYLKATTPCICNYMLQNCRNFNSDIYLSKNVNNICGILQYSSSFSSNLYINNSSIPISGFNYMLQYSNTSLIKNVFCNNINNIKASNIIGNGILEWTDITNGCYNEATNIYLYNNYEPAE